MANGREVWLSTPELRDLTRRAQAGTRRVEPRVRNPTVSYLRQFRSQLQSWSDRLVSQSTMKHSDALLLLESVDGWQRVSSDRRQCK